MTYPSHGSAATASKDSEAGLILSNFLQSVHKIWGHLCVVRSAALVHNFTHKHLYDCVWLCACVTGWYGVSGVSTVETVVHLRGSQSGSVTCLLSLISQNRSVLQSMYGREQHGQAQRTGEACCAGCMSDRGCMTQTALTPHVDRWHLTRSTFAGDFCALVGRRSAICWLSAPVVT